MTNRLTNQPPGCPTNQLFNHMINYAIEQLPV